jgi:opacity protein-like surface antigen
MRKLLLVIALSGLFCVPLCAQDFPKVEVFGGYSLAKIGGDAGDALDAIANEAEYNGVTADSSKWLKMGFMGSATFNINKYFGIEGNFSYNRGNVGTLKYSGQEGTLDATGKAASFTFMAGPRVAYRGQEKVTPFGHVLFGANRIKLSNECSGNLCEDLPAELEIFNNQSDTALAFAFGGGIDLNVSKSMAIRAIEFNYIRSNHGEGNYDFNIQYTTLSFGVVFKIGQ